MIHDASVALGVVNTLVLVVGAQVEVGQNICLIGTEGSVAASSLGSLLQCVPAGCRNNTLRFLR